MYNRNHRPTSVPSGFHVLPSVGSSCNHRPSSLPPPGGWPPPPPPPPPVGEIQSQFVYNYSGSYQPVVPPFQQHPQHNSLQAAATASRPPSCPKKRARDDDGNHNDVFHCTPCNLSFKSQSAMESHQAQHIQCSACSFRASPKVVKYHHQSLHGKFAPDTQSAASSGGGFKVVTIAVPGCPVRRFRICVGNRPDDVAQWIAERRKRFPRSNRNNDINSGAAASQQQHQTQLPAPDKLFSSSSNQPASTAAASTVLSSLLDGYGSSSADEDDGDQDEKVEKMQSNLVVERMQCSIVETAASAAPGGDSSEAHVLPPNPEKQQDQHHYQQQPPLPSATTIGSTSHTSSTKRPCRFFARNGKCRNGDQCLYSHEAPAHTATSSSSTTTHLRESLSSKSLTTRSKQKHQKSSLLEKLLTNDIRRERLLTIQLLEHIVDTEFLTKPKKVE